MSKLSLAVAALTVGAWCVQQAVATCSYDSCSEKALWTCSLHQCTTRSIIDLHEKQIWGTIPASLGSLTQLTYALEIYGNQLTGTLPSSLGSLSQMDHYFGFGGNKLTGTIPPSFGSLSGLQHHINLGINQLTGVLPSSLGSLTGLDEGIDFIANSLSGTIPNLMLLTDAKYIFLATNKMTGTVPSWFGSLSTMENVRINDNKFTGTSRHIVKAPNCAHKCAVHLAASVDLQHCTYTRTCTYTLAHTHAHTHARTRTHARTHTGTLPPSLGSLTGTVSHFYMGDNMFTGTVPASLCPVVNDIAGYCDLGGDLMFFDCPFPSACSEILKSKCSAACDVEPVNCVGSWRPWGVCSETCDGGTQTRTFRVTTREQHGGTNCEASNDERQTEACGEVACDGGATTSTTGGDEDDLTIVIIASAVGGTILIAVVVAIVVISGKKQRSVNTREMGSVVGENGGRGTRPSTYANRVTSM